MELCKTQSGLHNPVMLKEVIDYLNLKTGQTIVDATIGLGGHSLCILKNITPGGRLIGIDRDQESLEMANEALRDFRGAYEFIHSNFVDIDKVLENLKIKKIDSILFEQSN